MHPFRSAHTGVLPCGNSSAGNSREQIRLSAKSHHFPSNSLSVTISFTFRNHLSSHRSLYKFPFIQPKHSSALHLTYPILSPPFRACKRPFTSVRKANALRKDFWPATGFPSSFWQHYYSQMLTCWADALELDFKCSWITSALHIYATLFICELHSECTGTWHFCSVETCLLDDFSCSDLFCFPGKYQLQQTDS